MAVAMPAEWVEFGPRDVSGDFADAMTWPELPAEGWVGDAMAQIPLPTASESELLDAAAAWDRIQAWAAGHQARVLAEFAARRGYGDTEELSEDDLTEIARTGGEIDSETDISTAAELSLALAIAPATARRKLDFAVDLATRLPEALSRMCAGELSWSKASILSEQAANLTAAQCTTLQDRVLDWSCGHTAGQLRARIRRDITRIDSDALRRRAVKAADERKVGIRHEPDGLSTLAVTIPSADAVAAYAWLDEIARASKAGGDDRTLDQLRADAFVDLIGQRSTAVAKKPLIRVLVPAGTLAGGDIPGELAGYGPIDADLTRELAADGTWQRFLTDPVSGMITDVDPKRYKPSAALRDYVEVRDRTCRFPTCQQPAHRCDVDHTIRFRNGHKPGTTHNPGTVKDNLGILCRRHHRLKDGSGSTWKYRRTDCGRFRWTTPTGKSYDVDPDPAMIPAPAEQNVPPDESEPPF